MTNEIDGYMSNGPAYQTREVRTGIELEYVAEKLRFAIRSFHSVFGNLEYIPDALPTPDNYPQDFNVKGCLYSGARYGLRNAIVAYLALYNVLNLRGFCELEAEAENIDYSELSRRLDLIEREGSVL